MDGLKKDLTLIIPCAGEGRRLGLKTPKELYEIIPGLKLIDFSLMHIKKAVEKSPSFMERAGIAVVVRKGKEDVFEYVKSRFSGMKAAMVYFNDSYYEWPGSVYSAESVFSDNNLVLLPDSVILLSKGYPFTDNKGDCLVEIAMKRLNKGAAVFGYVPCADTERLRSLGALYSKNGRVIAFQDKPERNFSRYNGFWACYGFRREAAGGLYEFLRKSVLHQKAVLEKTNFYPPLSFKLYDYFDLGTWEAANAFKENPVLYEFREGILSGLHHF